MTDAPPKHRRLRAATFADRIDRLTLFLVQPIVLALTLWALFAPVDPDARLPILLGAIAVTVIFLEYLESVWSFSQPHHQGRRMMIGVQLILSGVLMILAYAAIYKHLGVEDALDRTVTHSPWDALYFSIVTTATVGYGDYVPTHEAKFFAAAQALMSIVWTGLFFGVIVSALWAARVTPSDDSRS